MVKRKSVLLLLTINCLLFFFINIDADIEKIDKLTVLWVLTIWGYMIYKLIVLLNYLSRYYITRKEAFLASVNYVLQFLFYTLFVYIYGYRIISIDSNILIILILLNASLELLTFFKIKKKTLLYGIKEDKLDVEEIKQYVLVTLMRYNNDLPDEKRIQRIIITVLNVTTLLYILIIPIIGQIVYDVYSVSSYILVFLIISICIFVLLNFMKYKYCKIHFYKYFIDMLLGSFSFVYYIAFCHYIGGEGFMKIFLFIFFLTPFFLTSYKVAQIYQIGRDIIKVK